MSTPVELNARNLNRRYPRVDTTIPDGQIVEAYVEASILADLERALALESAAHGRVHGVCPRPGSRAVMLGLLLDDAMSRRIRAARKHTRRLNALPPKAQ